MTDQTNTENHVYLKDRMRGQGGWLKTTVTIISAVILLGVVAGNIMNSF